MHIRRVERGLGRAKRGRRRWEEGQCLAERDDPMSLCPQRRGANVQRIERRQLDVQYARWYAHI